MMAWKPCVDSIRQAIENPSDVKPSDASSISPVTCISFQAVNSTGNVNASSKNSQPCMTASIAPPATLPSTIDQRGSGATSTDCRNPSRRSSISEMVEKMAVNSRINTNVPGK